MLGKAEIIVILIVVLIVFGANKLPEFARNLGSAFKEFKNQSVKMTTTPTDQTFSGHTQELRKRLLITVACFFVSLTIALISHNTVTHYWIQYTARHIPTNSQTSPLVILSPTDAIYTVSSLSFTVSLIMTLPLFIWQLYRFVKPGLSPAEHRIVCKSLYIGSTVFFSSVCITLFAIYPSLVRWLYDFNAQYGQNVWSMKTYTHFFTITVLTTSVGLSAIAMAIYILIGYPIN